MCLEINNELLYLIINVHFYSQNPEQEDSLTYYTNIWKERNNYRAIMSKEPGLFLLNGYTTDKKIKSVTTSKNSTAKEILNEDRESTFSS